MATRLVLWNNTFQIYEDALALTLDRVDLGGLSNLSLTQERAEAALIQSYHSIIKFSFYDPEFYDYKPEPFGITELTSDERDNLSTNFLYALKMAQVCEADSLLGGEPGSLTSAIEEKRRLGIREETVGESSVKFGLTDAARYPIYSRTQQVLSQYLYRGIRIGRA